MTLEKALNTEETARTRPQATFKRDVPVKVTFSKQTYDRRNHEDEPGEDKFHIVYIDMLDGQGKVDCGEAYPTEGNFDIVITVTRSAQPYAYQILHAAERAFVTRNISISYHD